MKRLYWFLIASAIFVIAAVLPEEPPAEVMRIIAGVISFVVAIVGPKPLKKLYDWLAVPSGTWRTVLTYVIATLVAVIALFATGEIVIGEPVTIDTVLAWGGLITLTANWNYHRLKDLRKVDA